MASTGGHASLLGSTLGGYKVEALLGRGAVGTVYLARDVALNRYVALKVLLGNLARNPSLVRSLHLEAQAAAPLKHANIVRIYAAGVEQGTPYIAMEYIRGESLERFLQRKRQVFWANALYIGSQVAAALEYAHQQGIVHRDVKPANILLDCQGRCHLTDFGIASIASKEAELEGNRGFLGTPHYMSPEQCSSGEVTAATDLYALGVTLYRMISGQLPFEGESHMALIRRIIDEVPTRLNKVTPGVPDDVARLVAHLLEKRPEDRPHDAGSVCRTIERLQVEKGGRSAIPAALAAFIQEQATLPELRTPTPSPHTGSTQRHGGLRASLERLRIPRHILWAVSAGLIVVAGLLPPIWSAARSGAYPGAAPAVREIEFQESGPGLSFVAFPGNAVRVAELRWVRGRQALMVRVEGRAGTLNHGAQGLVSVDLAARRCVSLRAPGAPATDPGFWNAHVPGLRLHGIVDASAASGLAGSLLLPAYQRSGGDEIVVATLAQRWDEAAPRRDALLRVSPKTWNPYPHDAWRGAPAGRIVPRPDGGAVCLVLYDEQGGNYLAERALDPDSRDRPPRVITSPQFRILPESVQYAPDGSRIAYMVQKDSGRRELWLVASGGVELNGIPLAVGELSSDYAFHPVGTEIAAPGPDGVRMIRTSDGAETIRLGPATLGPESWHPSGRYLVAAAADPDDSGRRQLWAMEAVPPYRREPLTRLSRGVSGGCAVSSDGYTAAAWDTDQTAVVLVDLQNVVFGGAT